MSTEVEYGYDDYVYPFSPSDNKVLSEETSPGIQDKDMENWKLKIHTSKSHAIRSLPLFTPCSFILSRQGDMQAGAISLQTGTWNISSIHSTLSSSSAQGS